MERIVLKKINKSSCALGTKISYDYTMPNKFNKYIRKQDDHIETLWVEYPCDLKDVPDAVLIVPFVGIMLTVTSMLNIGIVINELDKTFFKSLKDVEKVFQSIYKTKKIKFNVNCNRLIECNYNCKNKYSVFFTGGVDATSALIEKINYDPLLINIWGGDIRLTDNSSHQELDHYFNKVSKALDLKYVFVKTNAREMFNENKLGEKCLEILGRKYNHDWWSSIAHILSMTSTIAPFVYKKRIKKHYIGSSYEYTSNTFDSNNPLLIDSIKYCSCSFEIVDNILDRNDKVKKIIQFSRAWKKNNYNRLPLELKVCWNRSEGKNCSNCEKCYRTIMNIILNRGNPNDFGFFVNEQVLNQIREFLLSNKVNSAFWLQIKKEFLKNKDYWKNQKDISWILDIKINSYRVYLYRLLKKL